MSPEQAQGEPVDNRTDIWSFACVLYETLVGQPAFRGETGFRILTKVLESDPDWSALPRGVPAKIHDLLRRCLHKDPYDRIHSAADVRIVMGESVAEMSRGLAATAPSFPSTTSWPGWATWGLVGSLVIAAFVTGFLSGETGPSGQPRRSLHVPVAPPAGVALVYNSYPVMALSPDGRWLAYLGQSDVRRLYLQDLRQQGDARPVAGTEGAVNPFFSPDSRWLAFYSRDRLQKVALNGGSPIEIAEADSLWGASWTPDDDILFVSTVDILRVPAHGGTPSVVTRADPENGEFARTHPQMLPGGKHVLYTVAAGEGGSRVAVTSLETGQQTVLVEEGIYARYLPSGHIIFAQEHTLLAMPVDLERLETGTPVPVLEGVYADSWDAAQYAFSGSGTLAYLSGSPAPSVAIVRVDRDGARQEIFRSEGFSPRDLRISPGGLVVAVEMGSREGVDLWVYDLAREDLSRLTSGRGYEGDPIWSPDGTKVAFAAERQGKMFVAWKRADGVGTTEIVGPVEPYGGPSSWSPDGRRLAVVRAGPETATDILVYSLENSDAPQEFLVTDFEESGPVFSPNGRWIAYQSNETGRWEVYVRSYPEPEAAWKVSTNGGRQPRWSRDGRKIYYREDDRIMAATVQEGPRFSTGIPEPLPGQVGSQWDISPDAEYLLTLSSDTRDPPRLYLVFDWIQGLARQVPARGE